MLGCRRAHVQWELQWGCEPEADLSAVVYVVPTMCLPVLLSSLPMPQPLPMAPGPGPMAAIQMASRSRASAHPMCPMAVMVHLLELDLVTTTVTCRDGGGGCVHSLAVVTVLRVLLR